MGGRTRQNLVVWTKNFTKVPLGPLGCPTLMGRGPTVTWEFNKLKTLITSALVRIDPTFESTVMGFSSQPSIQVDQWLISASILDVSDLRRQIHSGSFLQMTIRGLHERVERRRRCAWRTRGGSAEAQDFGQAGSRSVAAEPSRGLSATERCGISQLDTLGT
jgi:hypothetical protein